jgi:hypothetical protein
METKLEGGIDVRVTDNGALLLLGDQSKPKKFTSEITLGKNRKLGEFALISIYPSVFYKPPAPAALTPVSTPQ